jgi:hypothetical protein
VGPGASARGGAGGPVYTVTTLADKGAGSLRRFLAQTKGPRVIDFAVGGIIDLTSGDIEIEEPYVTIRGETAPSPGITVRGDMVEVKTHDIIITNVRFRPGDELTADPTDTAALTIREGCRRIVVASCDLMYAPDVALKIACFTGATDDIEDVTVQDCIIGCGLMRSTYPASETGTGHDFAVNIQSDVAGKWPRRVLLYRNLITCAENRVPQVLGADDVDVINNVMYGFTRGPRGNPQGLNLINNVLVYGPHTAEYGLPSRDWLWKPETSSAFPTLFASSVWADGNVVSGFAGELDDPGSGVYAGSQVHTPSVSPGSTSGLFDSVLATVGARLPIVDEQTRHWIDDAARGTGAYLDGFGLGPPTPWSLFWDAA